MYDQSITFKAQFVPLLASKRSERANRPSRLWDRACNVLAPLAMVGVAVVIILG